MKSAPVPSALVPRFQSLERRLQHMRLYHGPIDAEWGEGVDKGLDALFAKAGYVPPLDIPDVEHSSKLETILRKHEPRYLWLREHMPLPRMVVEGISILGTFEHAGRDNNPTIMAWAKETNLDAQGYTADSIPWCGLGQAYVAKRAGYGSLIPKHPLWALNWKAFGVESRQPCLGDTLGFIRDGGGHVGLYIGEDREGYYHLLGSNQRDRVSIDRIAKSRLKFARHPPYRNRPASARPFIVAPTGTISTNER